MAQPSKFLQYKTSFTGDEHIVDKNAYRYDTKIENVGLNAIIQEVESPASTQQDQFHLWGSNVARAVCPRSVYFLEFVSW